MFWSLNGLEKGDEKCSINHVAGEKSNEKGFGAQADLKRVMCISATMWLIKRGIARMICQPGGHERRMKGFSNHVIRKIYEQVFHHQTELGCYPCAW
jgi:hypothetical protein